jgi:hypothetical protein
MQNLNKFGSHNCLSQVVCVDVAAKVYIKKNSMFCCHWDWLLCLPPPFISLSLFFFPCLACRGFAYKSREVARVEPCSATTAKRSGVFFQNSCSVVASVMAEQTWHPYRREEDAAHGRPPLSPRCLDNRYRYLDSQGTEIVENWVSAVQRIHFTQVYANCPEHRGGKGTGETARIIMLYQLERKPQFFS